MERAHIFRLESYLMYLAELKARGQTRVTSEELASVVGLSASRVRQDFTRLHIQGKPRTGYDLAELEILLYADLDLMTEKGMCLVGYGNMGRALAHSRIWCHGGFALRAIFDSDRGIVGEYVGDTPVRHVRELHGVIRTEGITCACLTVPSAAAQTVTSMLVAAGIQAIWNFAPVDLQAPPSVIIENQRLEQGLMTLSYLMKSSRRDRPAPSVVTEPKRKSPDP